MKAQANFSLHLFALLGIIFIPASSYILPFQDELAPTIFGGFVELFIENHFGFTSDTLGLNILLLILLTLAFLLTFLFNFSEKFKENQERIILFIRLLIVYYLASRMLVYGFDKVFKTQFYLPEPNTLYTPLGYLSKDILFWSAMGTSKTYCLISGIMEVIPAVMLLFKRTRIAGLVITSFLLMHVLAINIGFDISVKLYSSFLLFLTGLLLWPNLKQLFNFFFKDEAVKLSRDLRSYKELYMPKTRSMLKTFVVGVILIEALKFPISTREINDDYVERPLLHGVYDVQYWESDELYRSPEAPIYKRVFIHRRGYLILQDTTDQMVLSVKIDPYHDIIHTNKYTDLSEKLYYKIESGYYKFKMPEEVGIGWWFVCTLEDWRSMPALQDEFHWTIDSY